MCFANSIDQIPLHLAMESTCRWTKFMTFLLHPRTAWTAFALGWSRQASTQTVSLSQRTSSGCNLMRMQTRPSACFVLNTMSIRTLGPASRMWRAESKTLEPCSTNNTDPSRYHVPKNVRRHVDYVTPGVKLLEVNGAKPAGLEKRGFPNPLPPILRQLTMPLDELLGSLLQLCDVAVTPPCIEGIMPLNS